jgi:hypothetical protein
MTGLGANHPDHSTPLYYLALLAPDFYGSSHFHAISLLLEPVGNPAPTQVIGGQLNQDPVTGQDSDIMYPDSARDMSQYLVPVR